MGVEIKGELAKVTLISFHREGFNNSRICERTGGEVERVKGIEPSWPAWEAGTLPLCYTRNESFNIIFELKNII